jgi:rubrerythrin
MVLEQKLEAAQVLAAAIRSEVDATAFYTHLQSKIKNIVLIEKLKFLSFEEDQHRKILGRLFSQKFAGKPLELPDKSPLPPIAADLDENSSVLDLFKAALKAEQTAEEFYREAGTKSDDQASGKILAYLSRVERSHQFMIKSEIDLLSKFPDYYDVEDYHIGQDLFHIGP